MNRRSDCDVEQAAVTSYIGARRLVAAVVLNAIRAAVRGDDDARAWLAGDVGADWLDALDLEPDAVRAWAAQL